MKILPTSGDVGAPRACESAIERGAGASGIRNCRSEHVPQTTSESAGKHGRGATRTGSKWLRTYLAAQCAPLRGGRGLRAGDHHRRPLHPRRRTLRGRAKRTGLVETFTPMSTDTESRDTVDVGLQVGSLDHARRLVEAHASSARLKKLSLATSPEQRTSSLSAPRFAAMKVAPPIRLCIVHRAEAIPHSTRPGARHVRRGGLSPAPLCS